MTKTSRKIAVGVGLIGLGGLVLYLRNLYQLKKASDNIKYEIVNVGKPSIAGGKLKLDLNMLFTNPTNKAVDLETILLDINFSNGTPLASVTKTNFGTIQANNRTNITLPIETGNLSFTALINLLNLINNGGEGYRNLKSTGNYNAEGYLQTINDEVKLF
jgi:hypothetical protein